MLDATLARIGRKPGKFGHCVDYGCGVGRVTLYLARRFAGVIAPYLSGGQGTRMEMHALPQRATLELAHQQGMILRDPREDNALGGRPGSAISNTFTFEKAR